MTEVYCVVGATRGTGLEIARQLSRQGRSVRVVARDADKARRLLGDEVRVFTGDVTDPASLSDALGDDCAAIFYAVDITGGVAGRSFFGSSRRIRDVTYHGFVNVVDAARAHGFIGRIVLLSGMGCDRWSLAGMILNLIKGNLQRNMVDRERHLAASGFDYAIGRGGALNDQPGEHRGLLVTAPIHTLSPRRKVARADFARVLIAAAQAPAASRKTFDVYTGNGAPGSVSDIVRQFDALQ